MIGLAQRVAIAPITGELCIRQPHSELVVSDDIGQLTSDYWLRSEMLSVMRNDWRQIFCISSPRTRQHAAPPEVYFIFKP